MDRSDALAMDRTDPLSALRARFSFEESGPLYLDGNSLGRPPDAVVDAVAGGLRDWADNVVRGWARWVELPVVVGDRLGGLVGAAAGQVAVCDSTTVNLFKLVSAARRARPTRRVIVADADDFPTDRYVLQGLAGALDCEIRFLEGAPIDGLDPDQVAAAIDDTIALVCLSHVHYRSAARLDMASINASAHRAGALVLWDLSHSAGAVPVELDATGADLAVGCTYKYLNSGPGAPGFLYVRRDLQEALRQPIWGWFGQADQFAMGPTYTPAAGMGRFLTGSPPILGLLAVDASLGVIEQAGMDALWSKSQALTKMIVDLVKERLVPLGAALASPLDPQRRGAHISVSHPQAWAWCSTLIERGLVVGDFRTPDVIRLGPAPLYTRFSDVFDAVGHMGSVLAEGLPTAPASGEEKRPRVT